MRAAKAFKSWRAKTAFPEDEMNNLDLFNDLAAEDNGENPRMTQNEHSDWINGLGNDGRIAAIRRFKPDAAAMPFEEILFAIKRGESLHVRSATGEWLKSYSWGFTKAGGYQPCEHNWVTGASRTCRIDEIPAQLGALQLSGEPCTVVFHQIGDLPVWRTL